MFKKEALCLLFLFILFYLDFFQIINILNIVINFKKYNMKKITFIISFFILSFSFSQETHNVFVDEMSYFPNNISIQVGDQVQFIHEGNGIHDVNFTINSITGQPFNNPVEISNLPANGGYQSEAGLMGVISFDVPGVYNYDCSMYGHASMGMLGSITVNEQNCEDDDSFVEDNFGNFSITDCASLISFLANNYDYSTFESCSWNGSPMTDFGGFIIADFCECSCADFSNLSTSQSNFLVKEILYKVDILGNIIKNHEKFNSPYFIIYRDGSVKKFVKIK